jgi:predicted TIM-barrel fold metal-dependent hydrolase
VGLKLHGYIHHYPTDGANYRPAFEFADQHGLPVLLHTMRGLDGVGQIAANYPRMNLILAHLGFLPDNLGALLKEHPNLFADSCGSSLQYRRLENLARSAGADKILFATDATYLSLGPQIAKIGFSRISEDDKRLILGGNARRIFGSRLAPKPGVIGS